MPTDINAYVVTITSRHWQRSLSYAVQKLFFSLWRSSPTRAKVASFLRFLDHTQWHTTYGRTPLDEGSAHRRNLYRITYNTHKRQDIHAPDGISLCLTLYFIVLLCPHCPGFAFCPLLYNIHNTNIHTPGGIQTHNPSKRAAADPRLRPLGPLESVMWSTIREP